MSELSVEEYFQDFRRELQAEAQSQYIQAEFMGKVANELIEAGAIEEFSSLHYRDPVRGMQIDGYSFTDEGAINLFVADFMSRDELETLTRTEINTFFKRSEKFFEESRGDLHQKVEESADFCQLAEDIADMDDIHKVNFYLFSERQLSQRVKTLEGGNVAGVPCTYDIWDVSRLHRQATSKGQKEPLDLTFQPGLPCLKAHLGEGNFPSYLVVIPGATLAELYGEHGPRLLEQNVRSFLQARGNVNRGIRETILNEPDMFFAYNNGISATAREIETQGEGAGQEIARILDLQIVNGGQTTASLFHTRRRDKERAELERVFVQMKLVVIDEESREDSEEIVPRISRYANTQNRINAADFFSNHPFHMRMQDFSRRIWANAKQGAQQETKWFYERARGQYADAQSKLTPAERRGFQAQHPRPQMFTKTDLAKFENVWDEPPRWVNLGAQKNFAQYAQRIGKEWSKSEKSKGEFNERYFHRAIARAIIFRHTEKLVSAQDWYDGGYRANIVAYAIACLAEICREEGKVIDSEEIWQKQEVPPTFSQALAAAALFANGYIANPPERYSNKSEWAKKEDCWNEMKKDLGDLKAGLPEAFFDSLRSPQEEREAAKEARSNQKIDDGFGALVAVIKVPYDHWIKIHELDQAKGFLDAKGRGVLEGSLKLIKTMRPPPSEKQSVVLLDVLQKATEEGLPPPPVEQTGQ